MLNLFFKYIYIHNNIIVFKKHKIGNLLINYALTKVHKFWYELSCIVKFHTPFYSYMEF